MGHEGKNNEPIIVTEKINIMGKGPSDFVPSQNENQQLEIGAM